MNDESATGNDIDPELLKESGRASVAQDLRNSAQLLADRAKGVENVLFQSQASENLVFKRRNRLLIILVCLLLFLQAVQTWRTTFVSGPKLEKINTTVQGPLSDANTKLDGIVAFIHDVQAQQQAAPATTQLFVDLLCTTSDPLTTQYCIDHQLIPSEG